MMTTTPWTQANDRLDSAINHPPRLCPPRCAFTFNPSFTATLLSLSPRTTPNGTNHPILLPLCVPHLLPTLYLSRPSLSRLYMCCVSVYPSPSSLSASLLLEFLFWIAFTAFFLAHPALCSSFLHCRHPSYTSVLHLVIRYSFARYTILALYFVALTYPSIISLLLALTRWVTDWGT